MTTLREAAQQALEALEIGYDSAQAEAHQFHAAMAGYKPQRHAAMDADVQKIAAAITALRAALAEPVNAAMTRKELDALWFQAMRQSIEAGENFTRYHFAALVAADEREACAKVCEGGLPLPIICALAIRARGEV